jgi:transcriptional regulator with XRE-family HTH domain
MSPDAIKLQQLPRLDVSPTGSISKPVGEWLREIREASGLTQAQLAQATGMAQPTISKIEKGAGEGSPALLTLTRYLAGCGRSLGLEAKPGPDYSPDTSLGTLRLQLG